ncbi:MAG: RNA recognition motif domain-containing protein [Gammaproteobacteria bacterium]
MSKNIYVGNLSLGTTQEEIHKLFQQYGEIHSVDLITDRYSGESLGFAFVHMPDQGARGAIVELNSKEVRGCNIRVNEAKPRQTIAFEPRRAQPPPIGTSSKQA